MLEELQLINKVLTEGDYSLFASNDISEEDFDEYLDVFSFLVEYHKTYRSMPDTLTLANKFSNFQALEVGTDIDFLVDSLKEFTLYRKLKQTLSDITEQINTNSFKALENLNIKIEELVKETIKTKIVDINKDALLRYKEKDENNITYFETGIPALDEILTGWRRGEELVVFYARTGIGKSYTILYSLNHINNQGYKVAFISPEMSSELIGYRLDTINTKIKNSDLMWAPPTKEYKQYLEGLKEKQSFFVATLKDFQNKLTISKLRAFLLRNEIQILGLDGISYMVNERGNKFQNESTRLKEISEDLMTLSIELQIPILLTVQANRMDYKRKDGGLDLRNIRDSDGIAFNATRAIGLYVHKENKDGFCLELTKNRYGSISKPLMYSFDFNRGELNLLIDAMADNLPKQDLTVKEQIKDDIY